MKKTHLAPIFASVFAAGLLLSPSPVEARAFGYTTLKAGYSYETLHQSVFALRANANLPKKTMAGSSSRAIPIGLSAGFGYQFTSFLGLRAEAEYVYRLDARFQKGVLPSANGNGADPATNVEPRAQIQSVLGNAYLDLYLAPSFNFYLSTGIGAGYIDARVDWLNTVMGSDRGTLSSLKGSSFAWQIGGGMRVLFGRNLGLDLNVRYIDFGKAKIDARGAYSTTAELPFSGTEGFVGLTYQF